MIKGAHIKKRDLLECELLHGGVGHQVEEDPQSLPRLQWFLGQSEEHVLVQLFVHQQLLLAALVQADAPDAQQGVLRQRLPSGRPAPSLTLAALPVHAGIVQRVVQLGLEGLAGQPVQEPVAAGAFPPTQRRHVGVEPRWRQLQLGQALRHVAPQAAGRLDLPHVAEGVQPDARQVVLGLEVVPVAPGDVEEHLDGGVVGEDPRLDDKSTHLPAHRQMARDIQGAGGLEQLLGQSLVLGKRPKAYVDGREVFCLENHKTLGALQRVSAGAAAGLPAAANRLSRDLDLPQEEGQLCVGHFEVGRQIHAGRRGAGRHRRGAEEGV